MARASIVWVLRWAGRLRRPAVTTYGRCESASDLAPLDAGAEALEENGHHARDERETVETSLHHGFHDLRVTAAPPMRAVPQWLSVTERPEMSISTFVRVRVRARAADDYEHDDARP